MMWGVDMVAEWMGYASGSTLIRETNLYDRVLSSSGRMAAPLAGYPGVRLIGRSVKDALNHPSVQLEALRALEDKLKPDIVFTLLDLTVEADALGLGVRFFDKKPPSLGAKAVYDLESLYELDIPDPTRSARMPAFLSVAEELAHGEGRLCGAFVTGPLTLLAQLLGMEELIELIKMEAPLGDPLGFTLSVVGEYAAALASRVDLVIIVDPASIALGPSEYNSFCQPYIGGLAGIIRSSGAECLLYVYGDISHLMSEIALSGVGGIMLDSRVDLPREIEKLPSNMVAFGNIDPGRVLQYGTSEDVRREVRRLLRHMDTWRNFVLSTGGNVPTDVPLRNLEAMMDEVRRWMPRSGLL
jgi:uroporphyrinogen decarboxylase